MTYQVGDKVVRWLAGKIPSTLTVSEIKEDRIVARLWAMGQWIDWEFDPITGAEIDDDLGWGPPPKMTGSYIKKAD